MINFNAVDFSERRSEEVMFFFDALRMFNMLTIRYQELIHDFQMGGGGGAQKDLRSSKSWYWLLFNDSKVGVVVFWDAV